MNYTVVWRPVAEEALADLWVNGPDRAAVAAAADAFDAALAIEPSSLGESRLETIRVAFLEPLAVVFELDEAKRTAYVLKVFRPFS